MKIYEIVDRKSLEQWLLELNRKVVFGYSPGGRDLIITPPLEPLALDWQLDKTMTVEMPAPVIVPFEGFYGSGYSEGEACLRLALKMQEYLDQHPGETIRVNRDLKVSWDAQFDSMTRSYRASMGFLCDKRIDEIEAERAKRAE